MRKYLLVLVFFVVISPFYSNAQGEPIGQWRSHMPYKHSLSIAFDGVSVYVASEKAFYIYNSATDEVTPYSKVNGMADVGMAKIGYDRQTNTAVLGYANGNIDLFTEGSFYNIPDLKLKTVTGSKDINEIYTEDGLAYVSTDIGIIVINLDRKEIKETYTFNANNQNIQINSFTSFDGQFYAATDRGLYSINKNAPNIQAFTAWTKIDTNRNFVSITHALNRIYVTDVDTVFALNNNNLDFVFTHDADTNKNPEIKALTKDSDGVWVVIYNNLIFKSQTYKIDQNNNLIDSFEINGLATEMIKAENSSDNTLWIPNQSLGLSRRTLKGAPFGTAVPEGPETFTSFDIYANNKELWIAHGGYDDVYAPTGNQFGFSHYKNQEWENFKRYEYKPFGDSLIDFTNIIMGDDGTVYAGSTRSGLFILKPDGTFEIFEKNSIIDPSITGSTLYRVSGLALDNNGDLWMTVLGGNPNELYYRNKQTGAWTKYSILLPRPITHSAAQLVIDNNGQKWFAAPGAGGGGVVVYDDNGTPENISDDNRRLLTSGEGTGGLPNNEVYCLVVDKDGAIWIGTADGIGIVSCPSGVMSGQCEAEKRVVQFDEFAGYLFQTEQVRAIAVDGANRKWIGTNNGVWLISPDGDQIIERFTADNSPLPSDNIQKITIDQVTGDVYIGTEEGLVSYRGTAIGGGKTNEDLIAYPNPVPSGYNGTIAIKGFVENADVRITDISGQLVYRTTALGGQAVWNGKDYTGQTPQSGVYLIFATNKDGTETKTGKLVFME